MSSIHFSRFYAYRVQLQTTVDAATRPLRRNGDRAPESDHGSRLSTGLRPTQHCGWRDRYRTTNQYPPGHFRDFTNSTFTQTASFTTPGVNAVKVTGSHSAAYTFGRVWQTANLNVQATATAAVGYVGPTDCLKPWAVAYQSLLNALYPPAGSQPVSYDLTQADIATLNAEGPANLLPLILSPSNPTAPGNIDAVQVNIPWNGNNSYKSAIDGACSNMQIGPGTWLNADPGEGGGQTKNALKAFCDANGGTSNDPKGFTCLGDPKVKMAMWDINNGGTGAGLQFRVKYIGVFAVASFQDLSGGTGQIQGYFSSMPTTGGLSSTPTPLAEAVLVQ